MHVLHRLKMLSVLSRLHLMLPTNTSAVKQFGTNVWATVATSVPNFVRGMTVPITMLFLYARNSIGLELGAIVVGALTLAISLLALWNLEETFHKDLDYVEEFENILP